MALEPPQRLVTALGESARDGDDWLEKLPEAAEQAVALRELTVERVHVPGGRSSLVLMVQQADGTPAVLKLVPPRSRPESERAALAHWNGLGAARLLDPECADGALLLERLHRDVSVRSLPEPKALLEAAGTLRRLWVAPP
ncbi:aminoglycoside phosphotransferase family protein, partial [Streptomyces sp. NPDC005918]